jgi:hypothetical protein
VGTEARNCEALSDSSVLSGQFTAGVICVWIVSKYWCLESGKVPLVRVE